MLHHRDITLKSTYPERYNEWNPEDLVVMSKADHRAYHMTLEQQGRIRSRSHNAAISRSLRENATKGMIVEITNEDEKHYFDSLSDAADYIGCSRQLVSQCTRPGSRNKRACGWSVALVDPDVVGRSGESE